MSMTNDKHSLLSKIEQEYYINAYKKQLDEYENMQEEFERLRYKVLCIDNQIDTYSATIAVMAYPILVFIGYKILLYFNPETDKNGEYLVASVFLSLIVDTICALIGTGLVSSIVKDRIHTKIQSLMYKINKFKQLRKSIDLYNSEKVD